MGKYFIPGICVLPMICHWLLPSGIEDFKCYLDIFGVKFFVFDFLYIIYIIYYNTKSSGKTCLSYGRKTRVVILCITIILYTILCLTFESVPNFMALIINNMSFVWFTLLFILAPLSKRQILLTKPFFVTALIILVCEVFIFSLGLMQYRSAVGTDLSGQDFDGFMRISTTIGGATGSAVIIGLLGAFCISIYEWNKLEQIALIVLTSIGVFFTMSRGTSLVWIIYVIYFVYSTYLKHTRFSTKIKALLGATILLTGLYYVGIFRPIENRFEHMEQSSDFSAGRDDKLAISLKMIDESAPFGYGLGQVFPNKAVALNFNEPHHFAPHNMYMLIAIELGWSGLFLYILLIFCLMSQINYKNPLAVYLCLLFIINANTESVLTDSEYSALIIFAIMAITKFSVSKSKIPHKTTNIDMIQCS